jgi:hypothetical protein
VLALPAVTVLTGRATGLEFVGETVTGVRAEVDGDERATWSSTRPGARAGWAEWLEKAGWERPALVRLPIADVRHRVSRTERTTARAADHPAPRPPGRTNVAVHGPIEGERFIVMLSGYDEDQRHHDRLFPRADP